MKGYPQQPADGAGATPMLDEAAIAKLVEAYLPLAIKQADRAWLSPRLGLTREDLVSAGCYGLLLAARRFDPGRGIGFGVFARPHIHGAMMHEINSASKAAGVGLEDVFISDVDSVEIDSIPDKRENGATDSAEAAEVRELMEYVLTERERMGLTLYYFEELTLAEIAAVVAESESAVARMLKGALVKLKTAMADKETT